MRHLFFFTLLFYPIFASNISGIVIDESNNNPLFGANVSLSSLNKGSATNKNGEFVITDIRSGIYDLEVSVIGYKNYSKSITVRQDNNPKLIVVMMIITINFIILMSIFFP